MEILIGFLIGMAIPVLLLSFVVFLKTLQLLKNEEKSSRKYDKRFDEEFEKRKKQNEEFAEKISKDIEIKGFRNDE